MKAIVKNEKDLLKTGVYLITNLITRQVYVGSTFDSFKERYNKHKQTLIRGAHPNAHLQSSYDKYGKDNFRFSILDFCKTREESLRLEQEFINAMRSDFKKVAFNIEINVYKREPSQEIKDKISATLKRKYASGEIPSHIGRNAGVPSWNTGLKCPGISSTRRKIFNSIEVYRDNFLIVAFRSCIDLTEWSEHNRMPLMIITAQNRGGSILRKDKIYFSIRVGIPYKGLTFKLISSMPPELGVAKWEDLSKYEKCNKN